MNPPNSEHCCSVDHRVKLKENEKRDKYQDLAREFKKLWKMKVTVIPIVPDALGTISKWLVKGTGRLRNKRTSGNHSNYCIIKISQNTERSPEDLRWLAVTQTPGKKTSANAVVKNSQTSCWQTSRKRIQEQTWQGKKGRTLRNVQEYCCSSISWSESERRRKADKNQNLTRELKRSSGRWNWQWYRS